MLNVSEIARVSKKALVWNSKPTEDSFPELPEVLLWMRFAIAVTYGLYLGRHGATSPVSLLQTFNLLAFVPVMYARLYLGIDASAYGMKIVFGGLLNAIALTLLIWILCFTASHETDEVRLRDMLANVTTTATTTAATTTADHASTGGSSHPGKVGPAPDSEF